MNRRQTATISLNLTRDGWLDLESAILDREVKAKDHSAMRERLSAIRHGIETQVRAQKPRW